MLSEKFKKTIKSKLLSEYNIKCVRITSFNPNYYSLNYFLLHCVFNDNKFFLMLSLTKKNGDLDESNISEFSISLNSIFVDSSDVPTINEKINNVILYNSISDVACYFRNFIDVSQLKLCHDNIKIATGTYIYDNGVCNIKDIKLTIETDSYISYKNEVINSDLSNVIYFNIIDDYIFTNFNFKSNNFLFDSKKKFKIDNNGILDFKNFFIAVFITYFNQNFSYLDYFKEISYSDLFSLDNEQMTQYLDLVLMQKI